MGVENFVSAIPSSTLEPYGISRWIQAEYPVRMWVIDQVYSEGVLWGLIVRGWAGNRRPMGDRL